jgi:hypothetical protein
MPCDEIVRVHLLSASARDNGPARRLRSETDHRSLPCVASSGIWPESAGTPLIPTDL